MAQSHKSLIFIPDITGFTEFVTNTEIGHSKKIIAELLELIIDEDELGLTVAEIEGDAVLFFKEDRVPTAHDLISQARKTFLRFNEHLRHFEHRRICSCGACRTAARLTIKFVAHAGKLEMMRVKEHVKPYGKVVVEAHKLLKNKVQTPEYLILTDILPIRDALIPKNVNVLGESEAKYGDDGAINYTIVDLAGLHLEVKDPNPLHPPPASKHPVRSSINIHAKPQEVFETLIDLEKRPQWNRTIVSMEFVRNRVTRAGTKHRCVLPDGVLNMESIRGSSENDKMTYGERMLTEAGVDDVVVYFSVQPEGIGTRLTGEAHHISLEPTENSPSKRQQDLLRHRLNENLRLLKDYLEIEESQEA